MRRLIGFRRTLWLPAAALLAAAVFAFGACDGGDGTSDPEVLLQRMVLSLSDLPEGYTQNDEGAFTTNENLALGDEEMLAELEAQGRVLGYSAPFERGDVPAEDVPTFGIETAATLFETADGAGDSFRQAVESARGTDWESLLGFGETEASEVDRSIGDESIWIRVTGVVELGEEGTPVLVIDDNIVFRVGRAQGFIRQSSALEGSADRDALLDDASALAERQAEKMRGALD